MRLSSDPCEIFCFLGIGTLVGSILCFICMMDVNKESEYDSRFKSFEYHGHRYLRYMDSVNAFNNILHDPDCPCWTNRLETSR